nr:hypothetical protein Iba_chr14aCG12670 [Ipomoea batatas]GMD87618.1 hypothetical protein Iba_chr14bCG17490 [Ipomoea batatas]GMD92594.1 hypothetical protein Iba_chr14eCG10650 [Ipomoea batatas]
MPPYPTFIPVTSFEMSNTPSCIFLYIVEDVLINASSTFCAVLAEASINIKPCSLANCSPSSVLTALL